jgi:hypothetical protein
MHVHDQVSFLFMTRELSSMATTPFIFPFFLFYFKQNRRKNVFDSLYNCQFRLVSNIQWSDRDCMMVMIMINLLTGHRQ